MPSTLFQIQLSGSGASYKEDFKTGLIGFVDFLLHGESKVLPAIARPSNSASTTEILFIFIIIIKVGDRILYISLNNRYP